MVIYSKMLKPLSCHSDSKCTKKHHERRKPTLAEIKCGKKKASGLTSDLIKVRWLLTYLSKENPKKPQKQPHRKNKQPRPLTMCTVFRNKNLYSSMFSHLLSSYLPISRVSDIWQKFLLLGIVPLAVYRARHWICFLPLWQTLVKREPLKASSFKQNIINN